MKKCTGTGREWDHCRVEKLGCPGCHYFKNKEENDEQKVSKCAENKINKTN